MTTSWTTDEDVSDAELVQRVSGGDHDAFAALYDRYCRQSYSLARRICVEPTIAEEAVQEAFLGLWRNPGGYDVKRASFGTWLLTMVHHRAVDAVRRESSRRKHTVPQLGEIDENRLGAEPAADDKALALVVADKVRDALRALTHDQREVVALSYYGGYTQLELSAMIGIPLGTVKSRMFAGMRRLREILTGDMLPSGLKARHGE